MYDLYEGAASSLSCPIRSLLLKSLWLSPPALYQLSLLFSCSHPFSCFFLLWLFLSFPFHISCLNFLSALLFLPSSFLPCLISYLHFLHYVTVESCRKYGGPIMLAAGGDEWHVQCVLRPRPRAYTSAATGLLARLILQTKASRWEEQSGSP